MTPIVRLAAPHIATTAAFSRQLIALVEQFVDPTARRLATMLTDRPAHIGQ
jgi:hypothetical protein